MKHVVYLCIIALCAAWGAQAQPRRYSIAIGDTAAVPAFVAGTGTGGGGVSTGTLVFGVPQLDSLAAASPVYSFGPAYPGANSAFLRDIYMLETDDTTLPYLLHQWDSIKYYYVREYEPGQLLATHTPPNDYYNAPNGCDTPYHLEFIHALEAWDYTRGDTGIIIGVADNNFDPVHPDMTDSFGSKYYKIYGGGVPYTDAHGVSVAGMIAGATDNGNYLPAIGWKCRLEAFPNDYNMQGIFRLSQDTLPVINASFVIAPTGYRPEDEVVANEVYEFGTSLVAGAGNGWETRKYIGDTMKFYPASYENVISVSGVGHVTNPGSVYHVPSKYYGQAYSVQDQHIWLRTTDLDSDALQYTSTHNDRVDICAPAYGVQTLTGSSGNYVYCRDQGTSFAAPLVAGTMGLMMSVNKFLSPYQREVIIKSTARFLDTIGDNYRFAGKLGAGALRADTAVALAATRSINNDPLLQTMYISGIDFNHLCYGPPTQLPKLSVKVANGDGRYRYRWLPLPGNNVDIDNPSSPTPTVTTVIDPNNPPRLRYLVRVTDSSFYPKVAQKEFNVYLRTSGADLTMRDSYFDMLNEPNDQATVNPNNWHIWESPDLWNRKLMDGIRIPEEAEYFQNVLDSNHLYVRIRNVGCTSSGNEAFVKLYWTLGATGERWPGAWDTATFCSTGGGRIQAGGQITSGNGIAIDTLGPGDTVVISHPWRIPKPDTFCNYAANHQVGVCVLARIVELGKPDSGMGTPEGANISKNVRNNNNIVTRNLVYVNLGHRAGTGGGSGSGGGGTGGGGTTGGSSNSSGHTVLVSSHHTGSVAVSLQLLVDRDIFRHFAGDLSQYMYVTVHLGDLYDRWRQGGGAGTYAAIDAVAQTVTYDFSRPLRLDNIVLDEKDVFPVGLTFSLRDSVSLDFPVTNSMMHFRQLVTEAGKQVVDGDMSFAINIDTTGSAAAQRPAAVIASGRRSSYNIYPNPVTNHLTINYSGPKAVNSEISITDIIGRTVYAGRAQLHAGGPLNISTSGFMPGVYIVKIRDDGNGAAIYKVVKQ